jgi:RNA polymerase sigma factor (sigma-70 family)
MVARHGPALLRVANQFSLCHDDALDAYQRGLEIYLRRLATVDPATEGAWLRVVVKHEAMAIRHARQSSVDAEDVDLDQRESMNRDVDDTIAGGERVERSVEALKALKPDEARALLLKAEGLSYDEIGRRFGWTYTKVNRSIAEGRKRFLNVYRGIEEGEACERFEPVLDALAGGTATSAQVRSIRPHLRHCAACRATVRSMRFSRTRRIALLAPFAWLSRLMSRADVAQYMSSGGGRLGPAAGLVGLCLSGVGAGACVMSGALPAAPILAHHASKPAPKPIKHKTKKNVRIKVDKPTKTTTPEPPPRRYASYTPTPTPVPRTKKAKVARKHTPTATASKQAKKTTSEFDSFETQAASPPARTSGAVARTASVGGSSPPPKRTSGGGGGGGATSSKATSGEFGIEG